MGALLSLIFSVDSGSKQPWLRQPHHVEGDCHCACDDSSESSAEPHITSAKSAAVARDSPT
jgi:hypothetical protein